MRSAASIRGARSRRGRRRLATLVCSLAIATSTHADEPDPAPGEVEPQESGITERVEVSAALPDGEDVAAFATRLDTDAVSERGEDLAEVLRRVPGAGVRDFGGLGSYATVSLRASTAEQVTILVDGVPQNRALGGPVDVSSIPATQIETVTVFRGFAPASYGLGGIGGLVDVRTRPPGDGAGAQVDLLAGELETRRLSASLGLPNALGSFRVGAEALASEGDFLFNAGASTPFDPSDDGMERRANNDVGQQSVVAQQRFDEIGSGTMRLGLRIQRRERGVPGLGELQSITARLDDSLDELTASWSRREIGGLDGLDLFADGFRQGSRFDDPEGDLGVDQARDTKLTGGGASALVRATVGTHRLLGRVELRHEDAEVSDEIRLRTVGGVRNLITLTAEDILTFGRLTVAPSLRWESLRNRFRGTEALGVAPPADLSNDALTGKVGLAFVIGSGLTMRGSVGRFHRNPSTTELFGDTGTVQGNPSLRPESGDSVELGLNWSAKRSWGDWNLEGVAFARRVEDLIWLVQNSQATLLMQNVGSAEIYGLEASAGMNLPWGFSLEASGTVQRAEDTSLPLPTPPPLRFHPAERAHLGAGYERRGFLGRWELNYVGENSTTLLDWPEFRIPARVVHDVLLSYRWRSGLRASLDVRNVFDRQILDVIRYPLPSRVIFVHLGWRPGKPI